MKCAVIGIGGLGHLALKFLNKLGAHTTAFTTSEKKLDLLLYTIPNVDKFEIYLERVTKKGTYVLLGIGENNDIKFNYFPLLKKKLPNFCLIIDR